MASTHVRGWQASPVIPSICFALFAFTLAWSPIAIKNVTLLGPQLSPAVTDVSRDGGYSALINGQVVWLYDDTECMDRAGKQLSFVSNTAAYVQNPHKNISILRDFGVESVSTDEKTGAKNYAILADKAVGTGGWIPFQQDELDFNKQARGVQRVAIWPGTSPTSLSTTQAFLFAPLVYVDSRPQDPSKEYNARGMTLISITADRSGPHARRQGDITIPGTEVAFGGFSSILSFTSTANVTSVLPNRDVYMLGMTLAGLQLARAAINEITQFSKYQFWDPQFLKFSSTRPRLNEKDIRKIYLPGTFSSGSVFYSPFFNTFVMIYFNKMVDSTFRIRYLDLNRTVGTDHIWPKGGKNGKGIAPEDAEALVKYAWSSEQELYKSPPGKGGFNYAGVAHPEFWNRRYFAPSLYPDNTSPKSLFNDWLGGTLVEEKDSGGDGKHLLLSWTSQVRGGLNTGIYQVQLAKVEFEDVPVGRGFSTEAMENDYASSGAQGMPTLAPTSTVALSTLATRVASSSSKGGQKPESTALTDIGTIDGLPSMYNPLPRWEGKWRYLNRTLSIVLLTSFVAAVVAVV
ncbi:MAG: hypothetical protein Q9167_004023 [Letrouitia subvulpina]